MPVVPEKRQLQHQVQAVIDSQFWNQPIQSSRFLDGVACTAPFVPSPLAFCVPGGLSRTQLLIAAQSILPAFPTYCNEHNGLVADRVLSRFGGRDWWGAVVGRAKMRKMFRGVKLRNQPSNWNPMGCLADTDNYALAMRTKSSITRQTTFRTTAQVDSIAPLVEFLRSSILRQPFSNRRPAGTDDGHDRSSVVPPVMSAAAELRHKIGPAELSGRLAMNEPQLGGPHGYITAKLAASADVSGGLPGNVRYRIGALQVLEDAAAADDPSASGPPAQRRLRPSLYLQGAMAVHGDATLWEALPRVGSSSLLPLPSLALPSDLIPGQMEGTQEKQPASRTRSGCADGRCGISSQPLDLITFEDIDRSIRSVRDDLGAVRQELEAAVDYVASGSFRQRLIQLGKTAVARRLHPWTNFTSNPHLKVSGLLGAVGRLKLSPGDAPDPAPAAGVPRSFALPATLRPFAAAGVSMQLGTMSRSFFDFTRFITRLDVGLPSPVPPSAAPSASSPPSEDPSIATPSLVRPAAALDGLGIRHRLSISCLQQVYGPIRAGADLCFSLDSNEPLGKLTGSLPEAGRQLGKHLAGVRPALVDAAYGLDVVVPGSRGLARVVGWYSPMRGEGMVELRLL